MSSVQTLARVAAQLAVKLDVITAQAAGLVLEEAPSYVRSVQFDGADLEAVLLVICSTLVSALTQPDVLRGRGGEIEEMARHRSTAGVSLETILAVVAIQRRCVIQALEEMVGPGGSRTVLMAERRLDRAYATLVVSIAAGYLGGMTERWKEQQSALESMVEISRAINSSLDVADVAQAGLAECVRAMELDAGALWLRSGPGSPLVLGHSVGYDAADQLLLQGAGDSWFVEKAMSSLVPIQTGPVPEQPLHTKTSASLAAVSLLAPGELLGVLVVASRVPRRFKRSELTFLLAVGDQIAVALARALQHRLEARTDFLTGLANRPEFDRALERAIAMALRYKRPLSVVVMDLDGLKAINDQHGHHSGDSALREVAEVMKLTVRATDTCARLGGDEFGVTLPEATTVHAEEMVRRIRRALTESSAGMPYKLSISVGVGTWQLGLDVAGLKELADSRLYEDKRRHWATRREANE